MSPPLNAEEFAALMATACPAPPFNWAVAVSGGADSLALTRLLKIWHDTHQPAARGVALTVDHGLRPDSAREAAGVGAWMAAHHIPHIILRWDTPNKPKTGLQAAARDARYALMSQWCAAEQISHLFLAHHLDDQVETFVLRLHHTSGLKGLGGMRATSQRGPLTLHRPLLSVPSARLRATLEALDQPWFEDPSNSNPRFERVRIRQALKDLKLPAHTIGRSMMKLQKEEEALAWCAAQFLTQQAIQQDGTWCIPKSAFCALPEALQHRTLQQILEGLTPRAYPLRQERIARLLARLQEPEPLKRCTLGGCLVRQIKGDATSGPFLHFSTENDSRAGSPKKCP